MKTVDTTERSETEMPRLVRLEAKVRGDAAENVIQQAWLRLHHVQSDKNGTAI